MMAGLDFVEITDLPSPLDRRDRLRGVPAGLLILLMSLTMWAAIGAPGMALW
jgi:hypothetical protein